MECTIRWAGPDTMSFIAETGSGHSFLMDGAPEGGGRNLGPRPMETVLAGSAACTAYDVVLILKKSGLDVRATKIHLLFRIRGRQLKANLVERAIHLSHSKYCSATKMLGMTAEIAHRYELIED